MQVFLTHGLSRPLIRLGVWLFGNDADEELQLDHRGERLVDFNGKAGGESPFARIQPDLQGRDTCSSPVSTAERREEMPEARRPCAGQLCDGTRITEEAFTHDRQRRGTTYLSLPILQDILSYHVDGSPLPLAVAAAGPRLRLAGERVSVFYFPGAATSLRGTDTGDYAREGAMPSARGISVGPSSVSLPRSTPRPQHHYGMSGGSASAPVVGEDDGLFFTRVVRSASLAEITAAMGCSVWWYQRPTLARPYSLSSAGSRKAHGPCGVADERHRGYLPPVEEVGDAAAMGSTRAHVRDGVSATEIYWTRVPLSIEVVAPRVFLPSATAAAACAIAATRSHPHHKPVSTATDCWMQRIWHFLHLTGKGDDSGHPRKIAAADAQTQMAAAQFTLFVDRLWRVHGCAVVELYFEGYPVALMEWILSPEIRRLVVVQPTGATAAVAVQEEDKAWKRRADGTQARRAFQHVQKLHCRGRANRTASGAVAAAPSTAMTSGIAFSTPCVVGAGLSPLSPMAHTAVLSLCLTAVRSNLRFLDLSHTVTLVSLEGVEGLAALERISLTRCTRLQSISPLGASPALREIVASQSGIFDVTGLARSSTLRSLSLYGCFNLIDVAACGRIRSLRDLFISESTVEVLEGLQDSRSLCRLGMRYCDIPQLQALSTISTLTVLHAGGSAVTSVVPLQYCVSLEVVDVSCCGQLLDLDPLGLAPSVRELDASGSAVVQVSGLSRSLSLEKLFLANCIHLEELGLLHRCAHLSELSISGTAVEQLEGLSGAPSLRWLDMRYCRHLQSYAVLLHLPNLQEAWGAGCTVALQQSEEVGSVVKMLNSRHATLCTT